MMLSMIILSVMMVCLSSYIIFQEISYKKKSKHYKEILIQKDITIDNYFVRTAELVDEKSKLHERVLEIEDGIKDKFGVTIRQEITKVIADFDKVEMVFLMAGVNILIKNSENRDDTKYYLKLYEKIEGLVSKMDEKDGVK